MFHDPGRDLFLKPLHCTFKSMSACSETLLVIAMMESSDVFTFTFALARPVLEVTHLARWSSLQRILRSSVIGLTWRRQCVQVLGPCKKNIGTSRRLKLGEHIEQLWATQLRRCHKSRRHFLHGTASPFAVMLQCPFEVAFAQLLCVHVLCASTWGLLDMRQRCYWRVLEFTVPVKCWKCHVVRIVFPKSLFVSAAGGCFTECPRLLHYLHGT